ncbi:hypothetical protein GCM10027190_31570 [Spirosoma areae]
MGVCISQNTRTRIDSLNRVLAHTPQDTSRVLLLYRLANNYRTFSPDSSLKLAQEALQLAQRLNFGKGEILALSSIGASMRNHGELPQSLNYAFKALSIARTGHHEKEEAETLNRIGLTYYDLGEYRQAIHYYQQAKNVDESISNKIGIARELVNMASSYLSLNLPDSARLVNQQAYQFVRYRPDGFAFSIKLWALNNFGRLEAQAGDSQKALQYYREALRLSYPGNDLQSRSTAQFYMADLFEKTNQSDSSLKYAHLALISSRQQDYRLRILNVSNLLVQIYKAKNNRDTAFKYQEIARIANDSLYGPKKFQQLQLLTLDEQRRQQESVAAQKDYQNKIRFYILLAGLGVLLLLAYVLWRNNQQKQKANTLLNWQKEEIDLQRSKAENALSELKATQSQLIQREKMASLGELTAGIAHEIQNPLNFVNNFSEVSMELIAELKDEALAGNTNEVVAIADDLSGNLQKIIHHGGRASRIVKGMVEHSRTTTGERQPTNLNALADEYLRLSYQGQRAKDKFFQCEIVTDFDAEMSQVEVVPQEIGRVLLNLYNNAFYAVQERLQRDGQDTYQPTIRVSTQREAGQIVIRVWDNGTGIPESVKAKIFQPFFTTKPTGEGTGLGLSLSYDIITKGHGGSLLVQSQEGEATKFTIQLPAPKGSTIAG